MYTEILTSFAKDTLEGLKARPKHLSSKYFYDKQGDRLFQEIMHCPEYYLTNCEKEILTRQKGKITRMLLQQSADFDVVELGAGDCYKSVHLLESIALTVNEYTFFPIDISSSITSFLQKKLPPLLPSVRIKGLTGPYIEMLGKAYDLSQKPKLILFLGSSIGNMTSEESLSFLSAVKKQMKRGDLLLIGFDLKKHPQTILNAYNDSQGWTKAFNLNLLERINRELKADFNIDHFDHYPTYDPDTGLCKSYLVSLKKQVVHLSHLEALIPFEKDETILMEKSQKYTLPQLQKMAAQTGFQPLGQFTDRKAWFTDVLWKAI